jgi:hypothetical protein
VADGDHILELGFEDAVGRGCVSRAEVGLAGACARTLVVGGSFLPVEVL